MAYKRRKRSFSWLPTLGQFRQPLTGTTGDYFKNQVDVVLPQVGANNSSELVVPIVGDEGFEDDKDTAADIYINDALGQEYFIERVVGSIYVACQQGAEGVTAMTVTAGLFVAPKDPSAPTQVQGIALEYSPLWRANMEQPYMWRRTWVVGNLVHPSIATNGFGPFPPTNAENQTLAGPEVDVRSVRRVHKNERLWLALSATNTWTFEGGAGVDTMQVGIAYDLRVLGALRKMKNTSTFRA